MSLGREDLLAKRIKRSHADTYKVGGYVARVGSRNDVLKVVLFIEGSRYKGYIHLADLIQLTKGATGKVVVHRSWLKAWRR